MAQEKVVLRYFDLGNLGGRGSVVRTFLQAHNIPYEDKLEKFDANWGKVKEELLKGDSPYGVLPIVYIGKDKILTEHHSITRYFARQAGVYGKDAWSDYAQDALAEGTKEWRHDWVTVVMDAAKHKDDYANKKRNAHLNATEKLLERFHKALPSGIGLSDVLIYCQARDDKGLGFALDEAKYPHIAAVFNKVRANAAVKAWNESHGNI